MLSVIPKMAVFLKNATAKIQIAHTALLVLHTTMNFASANLVQVTALPKSLAQTVVFAMKKLTSAFLTTASAHATPTHHAQRVVVALMVGAYRALL